MNKYLKTLLDKMVLDEEKVLNELISEGIIDIDYLVSEVIKSNNLTYMYETAIFIKNAPINELSDAIIKTNDEKYLYEYAKNIKNAPINKLVNALNNFNSNYSIQLLEDRFKKLIKLVNNNQLDEIRDYKNEFKNIFDDESINKKVK